MIRLNKPGLSERKRIPKKQYSNYPFSLILIFLYLLLVINVSLSQTPIWVADNILQSSELISQKTKFFIEKSDPCLLEKFSEKLCRTLEIHMNKQYENDTELFKNIFYDIHKRFLKEYRQYVSLEDLINNGYYDCVTASALYSIVFEVINVKYIIQETNYHIYLMLNLDNQKVFVETTDPNHGFITDSTKIQRIIQTILKDSNTIENPEYYKFKNSVNQPVNIIQLAGIQFYNLAVKSFNLRNFKEALMLIDKALSFYDSDRIMEIKALLVTS